MEKDGSADSTWMAFISAPWKATPRLDHIPWLGKRKHWSAGDAPVKKKPGKSPVSEAILIPFPRRPDESASPVGVVKAGAGELEISMQVRLEAQPTMDCTLMTMVWTKETSTCLPCIGIKGKTPFLFAVLSVGGTTMNLKVPSVGLKARSNTEISFVLSWGPGTANVQMRVGGEHVFTSCDHLDLPMSVDLNVYLGSGTFSRMPPAGSAVVDSLVFRSRCFQGVSEDNSWLFAFDMPPVERELLQDAEREMSILKEHGKFDFFFGVLVAINSMTLGLEVQFSDWPRWHAVNLLFLIFFAGELVTRLSWLGKRWYIEFLKDWWLIFDASVVLVSVVDASAAIKLPFSPRIVRHIRLLKLARMLRLVRSFRVLGLLIEGMTRSLGLLAWICALMVCMAYTFALVIVGIAKGQDGGDRVEFEETLPEWGNLQSAMWVVLQMISFDEWTNPIRAATRLRSMIGYTLACIMVVFVGFSGLGLLNMMVGVMSHVAFSLDAKNLRTVGAERMKRKEQALRTFRQRLKDWGERPLFQNDRYISWPELAEAMSTDREVQQLMAIMEIGSHEILEMDDMFEQSGNIEIDGLMAALGTIILQRYFSSTGSDLVDGGNGGRLRPNDMLYLKAGMVELDKTLRVVDTQVASTCVLVFDIIKCLRQRADQAFTLLRALHEERWSVPRDWTKKQALSSYASQAGGSVRTSDIVSHVDIAILEKAEANLMSVIDVFFGLVLVSNGFVAGIQVSLPDDSSAHDVLVFLDIWYMLLYIIEFVFRAILFTHLVEERIDGEMEYEPGRARRAAVALVALRKRMLCGIVPPWPSSGCRGTLYCLPQFLQDKFVLFDVVIILLCLVDTAVFLPVRQNGGASSGLNTLSVMRVVRLVRLTRVLRIFRLFPQLQVLLGVFVDSLKSIVVVMAIFLVALYVFSILSFVAFDGATDPELAAYFGSLAAAAISGWQLVTFDHWRPIFQSSAQMYPAQTALMGVMSVVLGLGLLKLATGLVAGSAISMVRKQAAEKRLSDLHKFLSAMDNLENMVVTEMQTDLIPQELFEAVLGIQFLPRKGPVADEVAVSVAREMGQDKGFAADMMKLLRKAKLSPQLVKLIFEKIDVLGTGYIPIHMFTRGAAVFMEDLSKVDVFASTVILRDMKEKQTDVSTKLLSVQQTLDTVIQNVAALIQRTHCAPDNSSPYVDAPPPEIGSLTRAGEKAFSDLVDSSGTPGAQRVCGPVTLLEGQGTVTIKGDMAEGGDTDFRDSVRMGDMLLMEFSKNRHQDGDRHMSSLLVCTVKQVISSSRLRVTRVQQDMMGQYVPFFIAKLEEGQVPHSDSRHLKCKVSKDLHQDTSLSPRSAHKMFEWEVWTRHEDRRQLRDLLEERSRLSNLVVHLERQKDYLRDRTLIFMVFHGWRIFVENRRGHIFRSSMKWQSRPLPPALRNSPRTPRDQDFEDAPHLAGAIPTSSMRAPSSLVMDTGSTQTGPDSVMLQTLNTVSSQAMQTQNTVTSGAMRTMSRASAQQPGLITEDIEYPECPLRLDSESLGDIGSMSLAMSTFRELGTPGRPSAEAQALPTRPMPPGRAASGAVGRPAEGPAVSKEGAPSFMPASRWQASGSSRAAPRTLPPVPVPTPETGAS